MHSWQGHTLSLIRFLAPIERIAAIELYQNLYSYSSKTDSVEGACNETGWVRFYNCNNTPSPNFSDENHMGTCVSKWIPESFSYWSSSYIAGHHRECVCVFHDISRTKTLVTLSSELLVEQEAGTACEIPGRSIFKSSCGNAKERTWT
mmetsp:Transcript_26801/g.56135  ORF Transcript_26801/g.56135 Transcript_26801/m.56135 type:complete len:148 (-) Transcript_26801:42-485(-)